MGQRSIYNSTHKPKRSPNETLGFNHDDHLHRMCNETGIPMVAIVTSRACSLRAPTQQDFIHTCTPYLYVSVTRVSSSEEPSRVHYAK